VDRELISLVAGVPLLLLAAGCATLSHILYGSDTLSPGGSIRAGWEIFRSKVALTPGEFQTIMSNRLPFVD
jgi:hypothetical protein